MLNIGDSVTYYSSYSLGGATLLINFSWSIVLSSAGTINGSSTNSSVNITWAEAGSQQVHVSITNCGATVSNHNTVNVTVLCISLSNVVISGLSSIQIGTTANYTTTFTGTTSGATYDWTYLVDCTLISGGDGYNYLNVQFNSVGNKTVTFQVNNCSSNSSDSHAIYVVYLCVLMNTGSISGASTQVAHLTDTLNYTASTNGDSLFTYNWYGTGLNGAVTFASLTSATSGVLFNYCGNYNLHCEITNCSGTNTYTISKSVSASAHATTLVLNICYVSGGQWTVTTTGGNTNNLNLTIRLYDHLGTLIAVLTNTSLGQTVDTLSLTPMAQYRVTNQTCTDTSGYSNEVQATFVTC